MTLTFAQLFGSPDHYLHSFDGDDALFVPMDRAAYRRSIFLDRRISTAREGVLRVPLSALAEVPAAEPTGWIFHVAHCGSTLLARALDELGEAIVLREPLTLRQLALMPDPGDLLAPTLALLSRRYPGAGPTLIKANVPVNFLLPQIVANDPQARAVFLYCTLPDYLAAILRSDNHRAWLRSVTGLLAPHLGPDLPQSDADLAAMLWHAQMARFSGALAGMPNARSLDSEVFFARPAEVLVAATGLFGTPCGPDRAAQLVQGPLFNTYSKNPAHGFGNAERLARRAAMLVELGEEIAVAERWIDRNAPDSPAMMQRLECAALLA
jgi:hypothetical protein